MTECNCHYHRYHVVHIYPCGAVISNSQADWYLHKNHYGKAWVSIPSALYEHGMSADDVRRIKQETKQ